MYVHVQVTPKAKKETVIKLSETNFAITVKEPAERNLANRRVQEILAQNFNIQANLVRLVAGHRSPKKVYTIEVEA